MNTTTPMVEVKNLTKAYGPATVLDDVSFSVARGEIVALLGPNGAGKTTTVSILTTLTLPDSGTAQISGHDLLAAPQRVRGSISLTGQYAAVDGFQTARENLMVMCRLAHLTGTAAKARTTELLADFDLTDAADRRVDTYSGGMRRRLDLAISLVTDPAVLFLDEPTTGLDPRSRAQVWDVVAKLAQDGTTVVLTTQYLEEADRLADRILLLHDGGIVAEGTPAELKAGLGDDRVLVTVADLDGLQKLRRHLTRPALASSGVATDRLGTDESTLTLRVPTDDSVRTIRELLDAATTAGTAITAIAVERPTLDEVFLALTQTSRTEPAA